MYEKRTLPNGVRMVYEHMPHVRSAAIGVWIGVGSRYESPSDAGSAHFIEHMLFKGTAQHSASELAERMDAIGGQVNAYTTREGTCYYARVLDEHLDRAGDLLAEMLFTSNFAEADVANERGVIREEMDMYADTPEDLVTERLIGAAFPGALGRPVLGRPASIDRLTGVEATTDADGKQYVKVTQGGTTYEDKSNEIVIKDGTSEADTTLTEANRAEGTRANPAVAPAATPATQETAGLEDAAGESQPDPDAGFTLNETEEDSAQPPAQTQEGKDTTEEKKEPAEDSPKEDVVYEYAPADPDSEHQATKPTLSVSAAPTAKTKEVTLDDAPAADPAPTTPAEGSAENPTKNVIRVINNWVGDAAKELKIRLSNVNIKVSNREYQAAMDISGGGKTKIELDGQNRLDNSQAQANAGLRKQGEGTLTITDETDDNGNKITAPKSGDSGSLTAKGATSNGSAGIGGKTGESTKNIIIEGYATVDATGGGQGAGIGGGGGTAGHVSGDAENIIIRDRKSVV